MLKKREKSVKQSSFPSRLFILLFLVLFIGIRLINLPQAIGFGSDEGRDFLTAWKIYENKQLAILGPPSQYSVHGRAFFFGPAPYYVILPALIVGNWNPMSVSYYLILLNAAALLFCLSRLKKHVKDPVILLLFAFFCTVTPSAITYTRSYWNPYFMFTVSLFLLPLFFESKYQKVQNTLFFCFIGFLFGLGLQFHYSFIFAILLGLIWLLKNKKLTPVSMMILFGGFIIGFLPVIAYELTHQFYNLRTIWFVFTSPAGPQNDFKINGLYYFISLVPFVFFLLSVGLSKIRGMLLWAFLGIYSLWSFSTLLKVHHSVLDYSTLVQLSRSIEEDNPHDFNVVDQLTRDNQAMALRYMLTVHGFAPHKEGDYSSVHTIYIYSQEPLDKLLQNPIYEIKSFLPYSIVKKWRIENDINIYKLEK